MSVEDGADLYWCTAMLGWGVEGHAEHFAELIPRVLSDEERILLQGLFYEAMGIIPQYEDPPLWALVTGFFREETGVVEEELKRLGDEGTEQIAFFLMKLIDAASEQEGLSSNAAD